jgi:TetR/AcrR family transcriptional regulator
MVSSAPKRWTSPKEVRMRAHPRDAEATRQRILAAAEAEFSAKGLAGARVDLIAHAADSNKRMIYYYFGNKEQLYLAVLENAYTHMRAQERDIVLGHLEPQAAIRALVQFKFDYFARHPALIGLLNGENVHRARYLKRSRRLRDLHVPLVKTIAGILKQGATRGTMRKGVDPLQLYMSISAVSYFYFSNRATLSTAFGRKLEAPAEARARRRHAVEVILGYLRP